MADGVSVTTKIELSGNFFTHRPGATLYKNIGAMLEGLAEELEGAVRGQIQGRAGEMPGYTGWTASHVVGYTTSPETGKHWALWAAVGLPTTGMDRATAIMTKAKAAGRRQGKHGVARGIEERFHPFRQAKSAVYRSRSLISADLTKGLN